jgi:isoquinoline 1-oxidoreductase
MELWYESLDPKLRRRDFLKVLGGGVVVFIAGGNIGALAEMAPQRRPYPTEPSAYVRIGDDGRVTIYSGKIEMGQGVIISLAQMAADELGVALESVDMVMGDTDLCPWDMGTFGSMTTRFFGPALRAGAVRARQVLVALAAEELGVPADGLDVEDGVIFARADRARQVTFAELAGGEPLATVVDEEAILKSVAEFKVMGRSFLRTDGADKVTGKAEFTGDLKFPGLLHARLLRPPAHGASVESVDATIAERLPGVIVVREGDMIAALHEDPEAAEEALQAIEATFNIPASHVDNGSIFEHLMSLAPEAEAEDQRGSTAEGERLSKQVFEETYLNHYVAHAPMETHTAVAMLEGDKLNVWSSTQTPFPLQSELARELGLAEEQVRVRTPYVGGGFGGKTVNTQAVEAAKLAMATNRPVQVAYSRAEEFFFDSFRPAAYVNIKSGVDEAGRICLWDYEVQYAGSRGSEQLYDVPNSVINVGGGGWRGVPGSHPFATGAWRAPGANTNIFAKESQIDIMAAAAGADPLEFRLTNTKDERLIGVLKAAAERFGWSPAPAPSGRGLGIACGVDAGSYVAHMAEVEVSASTGRVQVKRVVCAQDMGTVINPDGALMQAEGCIMMGLGYTLTEEVRFRGGEVLDRNFDTYELPRFSWLPEIDVVLVENDALSPQGGGEPAIICMGGLIANAIFDATGARLFTLPMTPARVKAAIDQA